MLKQSVAEKMKTYILKDRYVKAIPYEEGMENGWMIVIPNEYDLSHILEYVNKIFKSKVDAEDYTTSYLFTREFNGKEYEIIPVHLMELADDEVEDCPHVVVDDRCFKYEFIPLKEDSLLVLNSCGGIQIMESDYFSDVYEIVTEEFRG